MNPLAKTKRNPTAAPEMPPKAPPIGIPTICQRVKPIVSFALITPVTAPIIPRKKFNAVVLLTPLV